MSTIIATLFLRTTLHSSSVSDGQTYLGLIFFAIIHMVRRLPTPSDAVSMLHPVVPTDLLQKPPVYRLKNIAMCASFGFLC